MASFDPFTDFIQLPPDSTGKKSAYVDLGNTLYVPGTVLATPDGEYVDATNPLPVDVTFPGVQPVSDDGGSLTVDGTFWQATQPVSVADTVAVSGTFWQAEQPVSLAAVVSVDGSGVTQPVSGTFWQGTQPVSGPLTDAQLRATDVPVSGTFFQATQPVSIAAVVPVTDNGGSLTVDGTFWQATQPVSIAAPVAVTGTFWQATQPVSGPLTDAQLRATAVPVSGSFTVDSELTSADLDTGAGTDTRAVVGLALAASGGALLVGSANPMPISDNGGSVTVDGTFWQATQPVSGPVTDAQLRASAVPVSGTFWQATQPVSVAAVVHVDDNASTLSIDDGSGSITVDGTFWQATQPVSVAAAVAVTDNSGSLTIDSPQLPAALAAGGGIKVEGVAGGVAQPVSGTFWQATQPVSGTFFQATQPVSVAAVVHVDDNSSTLSVDDGGGSLTVDGTVAVSGTVTTTADTELTTADLDTGAGTDTRAVVGLAGAASGGAVLVQATAGGALKGDITTIAGTAPTTVGKLDVKGADGDVFVRQATGTNLHMVVDSGTVSTITNVVHVDDNSGSLTVDAPVGTPLFARLSDGSAALIGQKAMTASLPVVIASDQSALTVASHAVTNAGTFAVQAAQSGTWNIGTVTTLTGITNVVHVDDNAGSITVDGTFFQATQPVSIAATVTVDSELTTADLDSGAGTDTRAVIGLVIAKSGGAANISNTDPLPISDAGGSLTVDGTFWQGTQPVSIAAAVAVTDNSGSLTVDAPVATPVFVRLSDGSAAITTLPVSVAAVVHVDDNASSLTVDNAGTFAVQADTELPAAASLADAASNPSTTSVGGFLSVFNGTSWDRARSVESVSAAPNVKTGILASGIGPGFDVKLNPSNLGTATNSAITNTVDGADEVVYYIGTSTTGTFKFEVSADDTNWVDPPLIYNKQTGAAVFGNVTPTSGDVYAVKTGGWRQVRIRTSATLGATTAVKTTSHLTSTVGTLNFYGSQRVELTQQNSNTSLPTGTFAGDAASQTNGLYVTSVGLVYNGSSWDRVRTAAGDAQAATGLAASGLMGFNGSTWDRVRTANTGRLQVDVVTAPSTVVVGNVASGAADSGNPLKIGGVYRTTQPTLTDGLRGDAQQDTRGNLRVTMMALDGVTAAVVGGGTQYVEDAALGSTPTGTLSMARRTDTLGTLTPVVDDAVSMRTNSRGALWVKHDGVISVDDNAGSLTVDNAGTFAVQADTELPAAATLVDGTAMPTIPSVGSFGHSYDTVRTSWDVNRSVSDKQDARNGRGVQAVGLMAYNGATFDMLRVSGGSAANSGLQVSGSVSANTSDSGNPVKIGGVYNTTPPTYTNGLRGDVQIDARGAIHVVAGANGLNVSDGGGTLTVDDGGSTISVDDGGASLTVDSTQLPAALAAGGGLKIEGVAGGVVVPVSDGSGSLTVDAPVGTPAFVRLSDGVAAITTLPVSVAAAATSIAKTEDVAAADADVGVPPLLRRLDDPTPQAALTSTDGDYTVATADAQGRMHVTVVGESVTASAQALSVAGAGGVTNSTTNCVLNVSKMGNATVTISGTWTVTAGAVPTLVFEASDDSGTTWFPIWGSRSDNGMAEQTVYAAAGMVRMYDFPCGGYTHLRVRLSTNNPASGTISIRIGGGGMLYDPSPTVAMTRGRSASFKATYRLAAVNAIGSLTTGALTANTDKSLASIHHANTALKLVRIRKVEVFLTSLSALSTEIMFDLRRTTGTPATGNPAITPVPYQRGDSAAEVTCLALPGSAGTDEAAAQSVGAVALAAAAAVNYSDPTPLVLYDAAQDDPDLSTLTIRPYTLEGYQIWIRSVAAITVRCIPRITFTEE